MSIEWNLRKVMANNNIWSGSELLRLMEDKAGYSMSAASISALMKDDPKMVRVETLDALCTALNCSPNDLLRHSNSNLNKLKIVEKISENNKVKKVSNQRNLPPV